MGFALGVSADETVLTAAQAEPVEQPNVVVNLDDASVSTAVSYPSRVTTLTGLYSHNHLVIRLEAPPSGYNRYVEQGHDKDNLATRLQGAGYATGIVGKLMNGYQAGYGPDPGWTECHGAGGNRNLGDKRQRDH